MINVSAMTEAVLAIEKLKPAYKLGHSGDDGYCDCIGLIIGALKRCGYRWTGIHGSNWAARNAGTLRQISSAAQLQPGEWVLKAYPKGASKWRLPSRYANSPDQHDYYHIGYVYSADPLIIIHCTGPGVIRDKKLGKWAYALRGNMIDWGDTQVITGETAVVDAPTGSTVNLRRLPKLSGALIERVKIGTVVQILEKGDSWTRIRAGTREGWMMTKFLREEDETNG